ncbi:MAG: hypothetical protein PHO07_03540 [Pirellulales bacterium]|nr:hypothetical protein [Thermoguttaceae bacterium]MDD4786222.1 hypothetical protein [Pirellulales bacterium]
MRVAAACFLAAALTATAVPGAELWIGGATTSITPDKPVPLDGHRGLRMSNKVESPVTATALALESREGEKVLDQAILVSCDLVAIRDGITEKLREKVKPRLPDFDVNKLVFSATHTHNAPVTLEGRYTLPESGDFMRPSEFVEFFAEQVAGAVAESWQKRRVGKAGWGQGQAVVAQNRRAVYADGSAAMYGATNTEKFRAIEGYEDHNLEVLFFWDEKDRLIATAINVACPSQEAEGGLAIHADFWHPVRETLRERYGKDLLVLGWPGAGGDQTSRPMYGKAADARMRKLRGLTRLEEVARRIVNGWEEAYEAARKDIRGDAVLEHRVQQIALPHRKVTEAEAAEARTQAAKFADVPAQRWNFRWHQGVVDRYEAQQAGTEGDYNMELHALRLGDVAIATNPFELYTDYGVQIKARSPAVQTFVIQLTCGSGGYLASERAVRGGGYGAVIQSSRVGPEGGQVLVNRSLEAIGELWKK